MTDDFQTDYSDVQGATVGVRFWARFIDFLLFGVVSVVLVLFGMGTTLAGIATTVLGFAYFTFLESAGGQSVGKMILRLKVISPDGSTPSIEATFKRNAWLLLGLLPGFLGALTQLGAMIGIAITVSNSDMNVGWHDNWASTKVIRI